MVSDIEPNNDYYDKVHRVAWLRRTSGILSGATLGAGYGGVIGATASFIPPVLAALGVAGATAAAAPLLATAALFAGVGATIGVLISTDVGAVSGSVAAGLEEQDKRHGIDGIAAAAKARASTQEKILPERKPFKGLFNWKTALVTVSLFAAFGAIAALSPLTAPLVVGALHITGNAAIIASSAVMGMMGATLGVTNSVISNTVTNFYTKLLNGDLFKDKEPEHQAQPTQATSLIISKSPPSLSTGLQTSADFSQPLAGSKEGAMRITVRKHGSYEEMILQKNKQGHDLPPLPSR